MPVTEPRLSPPDTSDQDRHDQLAEVHDALLPCAGIALEGAAVMLQGFEPPRYAQEGRDIDDSDRLGDLLEFLAELPSIRARLAEAEEQTRDILGEYGLEPPEEKNNDS